MRKAGLFIVEFVFAVFVAWLIYAFLRVHSVSALGFALVVMAAMAFLIVRYRKQAAKEQEYASNGVYEGDEDAGDDGEEW